MVGTTTTNYSLTNSSIKQPRISRSSGMFESNYDKKVFQSDITELKKDV